MPSFMSGGYLREIPKPHRRMFTPGGRKKRSVRLSVFVYSNGRHYKTSLYQEDNPIWNRETKCWQRAWDDDEGKGKRLDRSCDSTVEVRRWVRHVLAAIFKGHKLEHDFLEEDVKPLFLYPEHD